MMNAPEQLHQFDHANAGYRVLSRVSRDDAERLLEQVLNHQLDFDQVLKDRAKCLVARFSHPDKGWLVLKVPRARTNRKWERFLTLFRPGEGFRQICNMQELERLKLKGPRPVLAAEKRRAGVVVDSFYIYSFIDGREGVSADLPAIVETLLPLYRQGYCRTDPRVANHIINDDGVHLIDFRIRRPFLLGRLRCAMELCQLAGDRLYAVRIGNDAGYSTALMRSAWRVKRVAQWFRKAKQRLRKRILRQSH
ncbi:hypothetical protein [Marinobacter sp.]|uniref:hypothetical protein n=1 Tax=Marinobacter sp. TaxID=50741 RepID=UPI0035656C04